MDLYILTSDGFLLYSIYLIVIIGILGFQFKKPTSASTNLLNNIIVNNADQVTRTQLWDTYSIKQIKTYQKTVKKELSDLGNMLSGLVPSTNNNIDDGSITAKRKEYCSSRRMAPECINNDYGTDNLEKVNQIARKYSSLNNTKESIDKYLPKREIEDSLRTKITDRSYRALEITVLTFVVIILVMLFYEYIKGDELGINERYAIVFIDCIICFVFLVEFFLRRSCAQDKKLYWRRYWIDFVSSIPFTIIYIDIGLWDADITLRYGFDPQWLRAIRLARILRALRIASYLWRGMERFEQVANTKLMNKSATAIVILALFGAFFVHNIEGTAPFDQNNAVEQTVSNSDDKKFVNEFDQSIWWSLTTLSTGSFGDLYKPKNAVGWILTIILVIAGSVLFGVFVATLTRIFAGEEASGIKKQITELSNQIEQINNEIANLNGHPYTKQ